MVTQNTATINESRALLADRERESSSGAADVSAPYRYQTDSRVRRRFDRREEDRTIFKHHETLADELHEVVCDG